MYNMDYKYRIEGEGFFWSFKTLEEAERNIESFQRLVKDELKIVPIDKPEKSNQKEEASLKH